MNLEIIVGAVTVAVTFILGLLSKKSNFINNNLIPIQNLVVGIIASIVYYLMTKDVNLVIAGLGLFTGGTYDIANNLKKLLENQ